MKTSVAIALIVCGTVLIAMPYIHNTIVMHRVTATMIALNKSVNLSADIPKNANFINILCGSSMVFVGAIAGLFSVKFKAPATD